MERLTFFFTDDPNQAHRIRRFLMAVGSSILVWAVMFLLYSQGHMEGEALVQVGIAMLSLFVGFYALFRSRLNLLARDPSLTAPQILSSIAVTLYAMYFTTDQARNVLALIFMMSAFFGVFRLGTRALAVIAALTLTGYLMLIGLLLRHRPQDVDLGLELLRCATTGAVLFWFSLMGGYLSRLRKRLSVSKADLETALRTINEMATTDELTGTYNRHYLMDMLQREKSRHQRTGSTFCICIADIDHFKQINDTLGHAGGDEVLRGIARATRQWLRVTDYFGRYGGDELMLILTDTQLDGARIAAERLRNQAQILKFSDVDPTYRASLSIGVAQYRPGEDVAQTIRRADIALYQAKEGGRNRVHVAPEPQFDN